MIFGIQEFVIFLISIPGMVLFHELGHIIPYVMIYRKFPLIRISWKDGIAIGQEKDYQNAAAPAIYFGGVLFGMAFIVTMAGLYTYWIFMLVPGYIDFCKGDLLYLFRTYHKYNRSATVQKFQ